MKKQENVTKVNVVCLSDGESQPMSYTSERPKDEFSFYEDAEFRVSSVQYSHGKIFFLRDPETGYTRKISNSPYETTQTLVSYMREITDYNWVGIRICSKGELMRLVRSLSFEENFAFCPVEGSTTIIVIPSATLNGLASDFLIAFLIKLLNTGKAVFDPVSNLPKG